MSWFYAALVAGGAWALKSAGKGGSRPTIPPGESPWLVDRGRVTRGFVPTRMVTRADGSRINSPHHGLDVANDEPTPVRSLMTGTVLWSRPICGYGNTVAIRHSDNLSTLSAHLAEPSPLAEGDPVYPGSVIGIMGATTHCPNGQPPPNWAPGRAAGMPRHVHWEVHRRATPALGRNIARVDPAQFIIRNHFRTSRS